MKGEKMQWPAVPFRSKSGQELAKKFSVRGIPTLIVMSPGANVVSKTARMEVTLSPDTCIEDWKKIAAEADKGK